MKRKRKKPIQGKPKSVWISLAATHIIMITKKKLR